MANVGNAKYHIGSASAAQTLTDSYATGSTAIVDTVDRQTVGVATLVYVPKSGQSNRNCTLKIQKSPDGGTTWVSLGKGSDAAPASAEIVTTMYDSVYKLPGATGGTTYTMEVPFEIREAGLDNNLQLRVLVKEDGSANFGTAKVIVSLIQEDV